MSAVETVDNNDFGREGAKHIAGLLAEDRTLQSFCISIPTLIALDGNNLYTEGAIRISNAMKTNKSINSLELSISSIKV